MEMRINIAICSFCLLVLQVLAVPSWAATATTNQIEQTILKAKILTPGFPVKAQIMGNEVEIRTHRNPKATDRDCRIDAALIAKAIAELKLDKVQKVRVVFYERLSGAMFKQVAINLQDIKSFGSGNISPDELLAKTELVEVRKSYQELTQAPAVVPGISYGERLEIFGRIQRLKALGVGVGPYEQRFLVMEDLVRRGTVDNVDANINDLAKLLNEAVERYNALHPVNLNNKNAQRNSHNSGQSSGSGVGLNKQATQALLAQGSLSPENLHREYGNLAPVPGIQLHRRALIASRLKEKQANGESIELLLAKYEELQDHMRKGDYGDVLTRITELEDELGLK
jgi:hypothetical protein